MVLNGVNHSMYVSACGKVKPKCSHWGQGDLETSGNILGKLWAPDHFSPNVSTNHILGTSRL